MLAVLTLWSLVFPNHWTDTTFQTCQAEAWKKFHKFECRSFSRIPQDKEIPSAVRAAIQIVNMRTHGVLSNSEWEEFQRMISHIEDMKGGSQSRWSDFVLMTMGVLHYSSAKEKFTLEDVQHIFARVNNMQRMFLGPLH
jgi:SET and MYND domain-containing protein